jgi:hypothetical protein
MKLREPVAMSGMASGEAGYPSLTAEDTGKFDGWVVLELG